MHALFDGKTGSGKSYAMKQMLLKVGPFTLIDGAGDMNLLRHLGSASGVHYLSPSEGILFALDPFDGVTDPDEVCKVVEDTSLAITRPVASLGRPLWRQAPNNC